MQSQYGSDYQSPTVISASQQLAMSRFVSRTYGWMFFGLLITGFVSYFISSDENMIRAIVTNRGLFMGALILELVTVVVLTMAYRKLSATAATLGFLFYSALNGVTFSVIFLTYTMSSIAQVFMITAGMFGGLALYGSVTKKDLTGVGSFVGMGLWGLILIGLANMFIRSEALNMGLAVAGVVIFAGLTAYDAQKIRAMAYQASTGESSVNESNKGAVFAALMLYLNFINLFLSLLRLFGNRRD